jgi:ABC-type spermidine/putrescine transport system permease subunit II
MERQPLSFFLKGASALAVLLLLTSEMQSRPEVNALRAMIVLGLAIIVLKVVLRRYNIDWPSRRHRRFDPPRRQD